MKSQTTHYNEQLKFLIGKWKSDGVVLKNGKNPEIPIKGTDIYEWTLDEKFILHTVAVHIGEHPVRVIELIGYEKTKKSFTFRAFDNAGDFTRLQATFKNGKLKISGKKMRSTLTIIDNEHMTAKWENLKGSKWINWMEMNFTKTNA